MAVQCMAKGGAMSATATSTKRQPDRRGDPLVVVSCDSHVSAPATAYREYCSRGDLPRFEEYLAEAERIKRAAAELIRTTDTSEVQSDRMENLHTDGHFNIDARIRDMDRDGVAAEVIFHGSPPFDPIPFAPLGVSTSIEDLELAALGMRMYNRWLADFCSVEPERHVGLAQLPMWDIDAAMAELQLAHDLGLHGVNFPCPRLEIMPYEDPAWDPFWS
jgi:predicted TIM-barrel fold metal-dependent hydrolase